ncbi:hypothetical protein A8C56_17575 [Niabella ginsenosidivorans]|uniref:KilA-N DNA-binding domain-containing protein n=1 Tax=Niabella ginsenosidivorans TaxID=1176587 RepID=A0A1A9I4R3_9BACT|nr:ORF6N domain-containing protein [Niabella ginsenosidivorans]ANH82543.1 hypothetical protein A8C56_17575 [Niabella ginsenosidivorans]
MENRLIITDELLLSKILHIRNKRIMIDRDLAELYGVPANRLNEQVKRIVNVFLPTLYFN